MKKKILITNDDGVNAPGIKTLASSVTEIAEVCVVAPDRERSASGHSLTLDKPLKVNRLDDNRYSLNGTPTDCVIIGVSRVLGEKPDLIISGINNGPNLGDDITYSGTVAAAMEGTILSIPSIAISMNATGGATPLFETGARVAMEIAHLVMKDHLPYDTLLNINVPNVPYDEIKGMAFTRQGKRVYEGAVHDTVSPWGEKCYWIGGGTPYWEHGDDTDMCAVLDGYVSVTPLHLDLTNYDALNLIKRQWNSGNRSKPGC